MIDGNHMATTEGFSASSHPIAMRVTSALVTVFTDEDTLTMGSGVLVKLGGVEFVFTAGHIPWNKPEGRLNKVCVIQGIPPFFLLYKPGDGSVARTIHAPVKPGGFPDPDVAVFELGPDPKLIPSRRPFLEAEIGRYDNEAPARRLLLTGFPRGSVKARDDLANLGTDVPPLDGTVISFEALTLPGHRADEEPKSGRGVHVFLEFEGTIISHPKGVSGGPLVVPEGDGVLVGLARSKTDFANGFDQWCEPVVEAVRLLVDHPNAQVAAAARRVVARLSPITQERGASSPSYAAEQVAGWRFPPEQRIRGVDLPAELRDKPRLRVPLEFRDLNVAPGEHVTVRVIPPRPFLGDTIRIAEDVAIAFELDEITVGNLSQTKPGQTLPATACSPAAQLRLNDWCLPGMPLRIRARNIGTAAATFRCELEGEMLVADGTPKPVKERALSLRARLDASPAMGDNAVFVAKEAHRLFEEAGDEIRVRWLDLELGGYRDSINERPLHAVLHVPQNDRLVAHVAAYRTQSGVELLPQRGRPLRAHFFVESLDEILNARTAVRARYGEDLATGTVELDFSARIAGYPARAEFPRNVFERIASGFIAALYLQLASVA
ncbi:MAG: hypothetical protein ACRENE_04085 [Polyangiaceae bacterium]